MDLCAWRETRNNEPEAAAYEHAISDVCRFAKQSTAVQEQLPKSLKHGGDTRPWVSMFRRAESVECSYEALVSVLTAKNKLELIASVNRVLNCEIMDLTKGIKDVFESLEKVNEPTLQLVAPSYYLLMQKFKPGNRETKVVQTFKKYLLKYLDDKFWTSINAFHWIATFLDPTFKHFEFLPQANENDVRFKRNLMKDLDDWILADMKMVVDKMSEEQSTNSSRL